MERIDIFSRVNMADVMGIAIITLPRKDCMTLFTKVQSGFTKITCIRPEDGMKTCLYCESTNWSKSNDTCYLYYSYGSGKIDFIASYKDEDSMFDAMNENNSDLDPVRYTFSSLDYLEDNKLKFLSVKNYIDGLRKSLIQTIQWFGMILAILLIVIHMHY